MVAKARIVGTNSELSSLNQQLGELISISGFLAEVFKIKICIKNQREE